MRRLVVVKCFNRGCLFCAHRVYEFSSGRMIGTRGVTVLDAVVHGHLVWLSHFASEQNSNEPPCLRLKRLESHLQLPSWMGIM